MLGAQALRTKQKAEQKEKEKRQRERLKSLEMARDRLHRAACEEAVAQYIDLGSAQAARNADLKHRHSLHSTHVNHLRINDADLQANGFDTILLKNGTSNGPQRSTSTDHCRQAEKKYSVVSEHSNGGSGGNKFLKWLGLGGNEDKKSLKEMKEKDLIAAHKEYKRRMSTFT